eukprot:scaffold15705_cov31-Attheya_sp.AAC.1
MPLTIHLTVMVCTLSSSLVKLTSHCLVVVRCSGRLGDANDELFLLAWLLSFKLCCRSNSAVAAAYY